MPEFFAQYLTGLLANNPDGAAELAGWMDSEDADKDGIVEEIIGYLQADN